MKEEGNNTKSLIEIFERTLEDRSFSRGEKKAVTGLLKEDFDLDKKQRDLLRSKIFDLARRALNSNQTVEVLDWLEAANKLLLRDYDSSVAFSPGRDCRNLILSELKSAIYSVDICVFTISDNKISEAILECSRRGIEVRIITDNDKADDPGSDIKRIASAGLQVRMDQTVHHMHHKFAVFDKQRVLTGSYNWTRSAAEENQENILLTGDKSLVHSYILEFEKLWPDMIPLR